MKLNKEEKECFLVVIGVLALAFGVIAFAITQI